MAVTLHRALKRDSIFCKSVGSLDLSSKHGSCFKPKSRGFHVTARRPFVSECLVPIHSLICGLHDFTGLPWVASIPLTAFVVRAAFLFPMDWSSRKLSTRLQTKDISTPMIPESITRADLADIAQQLDRDYIRRLVRRLLPVQRQNGRWILGLPTYILKVPVWLAIMETLRRMTGVDQGLLSLVSKSVTGSRTTVSDLPPDGKIPIEHSLVTEGMLWFPNLQLFDPSLAMPFMLAAVWLAQAFYNEVFLGSPHVMYRKALASQGWNTPETRRAFRAIILLPLAIGPATLQFPSALLLYWISNDLLSLGTKYLIVKWVPFENPSLKVEDILESRKQQFRGPKMGDLRKHKKKQNKKRS